MDASTYTSAQPTGAPAPEPKPAPPASAATSQAGADIENFAKNIARMIEEGGKALAAYLKPREEGRIKDQRAEEITDVVKTLGQVVEYWLSDPQRAFDLQSRLGQVLSRSLGRKREAHGRRTDGPGRKARSARQALRRPGMVHEPVLRFPQAGLSAHDATGPTSS